MHHLIYKITNILNGRFYIGMHSTKNPHDGYLGSGKRIKAEINKYGKENFRKEILEQVSSRKILKEREAQIVNSELLADPLCLNLIFGGEGGWETYNANSELQRAKAIRGNAKQKILKETDSEWAEKASQSRSNAMKQRHTAGNVTIPSWTGKHHCEEAKRKIGEKNSQMTGEKNSQFGTCWVTNGVPLKIKKDKLDEYLAMGYSRGRKSS